MFEEYGLSTEEANEVLKLISEYNTTNVNVTGNGTGYDNNKVGQYISSSIIGREL